MPTFNEAWATRFLHDLFSTSTVLFVGYGHNDRVMTYLARGLSREHQNRYIMVPRKMDNDNLWQSLRLKPIPYTTMRGSRPHIKLTESVESWSHRSRMGLLDHAIRIREITTNNPPSDPTQNSYLSRATRRCDQVRIITNYAKGPEWIDTSERLCSRLYSEERAIDPRSTNSHMVARSRIDAESRPDSLIWADFMIQI